MAAHSRRGARRFFHEKSDCHRHRPRPRGHHRALLAEYGVNVLDISQTVMNEYFTMVMLADVQGCTTDFSTLRDALVQLGEEMALSIRIQHEDIFNAMHAVN